MTTPIHLPLHRWPLGWQCVLALAAVVAVGLGAQAWVRVSEAHVLEWQRTLDQGVNNWNLTPITPITHLSKAGFQVVPGKSHEREAEISQVG